MTAASGMVHVHPGGSLLDHLEGANIPGGRLEWCDPVCSGPTPAGLLDDEWYRVRAEHLGGGNGAAVVEERLRAQDAALAALPTDAEIVLWVGPDLFCQSALLCLLGKHLRARQSPMSLVDPGDHPAHPGCSVSHLSAAELVRACAERQPVSRPARLLAEQGWQAFTAPTERPLLTLLAGDTSPLPHLGPALRRHLADLPDGGTGLSTSETHVLEILRSGARDLAGLLQALAQREARPWFTDMILSDCLHRLAGGDGPVIAPQSGGRWGLTRRGQDVLAGADTWTAARWLGGIPLGIGTEESD